MSIASRDVLETLRKLPPTCAANVDGEAVFIHRGARHPTPAFMAVSQVPHWNRDRKISDAQVQAMIAGVSLGWDTPAADPDTHLTEDDNQGPFTYDFCAELPLSVRISAPTEEDAARRAASFYRSLTWEIWDAYRHDHRVLNLGNPETIDLIDSTDLSA